MITPGALAELLEGAVVRIRPSLVETTETLMTVGAQQARDAIGTYEWGWTPLAAATMEDRVQKGFSANEPLKRTGALQASVVGESEPMAMGAEGAIGSSDRIAYYHEFGTKNMPARSIFAMAMMICTEETAPKLFEEFALSLLSFAK